MVSVLDEIIGNISDLLKEHSLWNDTLLILSSDNGGSLDLDESGSNNSPLRGSKYSEWEGGIRSVAFVSGGYLPQSRRGQKEFGMIAIADWYSTFCAIAGVEAADDRAAEYGLPPIDSLNVWPLISGQNMTSPRTQIAVSAKALISENLKYLGGNMSYASWPGSKYPNASSVQSPVKSVHMDCTKGCLFDVVQDMTEHIDIASEHQEIVEQMAKELEQQKLSFYSNDEVGVDSCPKNISMECACWMAINHWNGYFGPYQFVKNVNASNSKN